MVRVLRNLTYKQDAVLCTDLVIKITNVGNYFPHDQAFAAPMASALVNLALTQTNEEAGRGTLAKSEAIQKAHPDHTDIQLSHAMTWFNLTLVQKEDDICTTVSEIITYLQVRTDIIPGFKEALDKYLAEHQDHIKRYQLLLEL